jgi:glutamate synthase (NADPH/NADH) small chain
MDLKLELDKRGRIQKDENKMTCLPGIFAAGDAELGASLVVHAIFSGRQAAEGVHQYLTSERTLKLGA